MVAVVSFSRLWRRSACELMSGISGPDKQNAVAIVASGLSGSSSSPAICSCRKRLTGAWRRRKNVNRVVQHCVSGTRHVACEISGNRRGIACQGRSRKLRPAQIRSGVMLLIKGRRSMVAPHRVTGSNKAPHMRGFSIGGWCRAFIAVQQRAF